MFVPDPFDAITIDLYKPGSALLSGFRYVLTIVDLCTRWVQFVPLRPKYAAEVMLTLVHHWFAFHSIPEFILSTRGREFMGTVTTVCKTIDIKQIKMTPLHPQSNGLGLCEVHHKTLTRELRVRLKRKSAPAWSDLLPEIHFVINISPDEFT